MNIILEFGFFLLYSTKQSKITQPLDICVNESLIELQSRGTVFTFNPIIPRNEFRFGRSEHDPGEEDPCLWGTNNVKV